MSRAHVPARARARREADPHELNHDDPSRPPPPVFVLDVSTRAADARCASRGAEAAASLDPAVDATGTRGDKFRHAALDVPAMSAHPGDLAYWRRACDDATALTAMAGCAGLEERWRARERADRVLAERRRLSCSSRDSSDARKRGDARAEAERGAERAAGRRTSRCAEEGRGARASARARARRAPLESRSTAVDSHARARRRRESNTKADGTKTRRSRDSTAHTTGNDDGPGRRASRASVRRASRGSRGSRDSSGSFSLGS